MVVAMKGKQTVKTTELCYHLSTLHRREICQACYGVIKNYLKGSSRKNENYLARFLAFFKTQVGMGLNAEEDMIEMVEDNRYKLIHKNERERERERERESTKLIKSYLLYIFYVM